MGRRGNRFLKLRLNLLGCVATILSAYAPLAGPPHEQKESFYHMLLQTAAKTNANDYITVVGDFNLNVGRQSDIFNRVRGGHSFGIQNEESTRLLETCDVRTSFRKPAIQPPDNLSVR